MHAARLAVPEVDGDDVGLVRVGVRVRVRLRVRLGLGLGLGLGLAWKRCTSATAVHSKAATMTGIIPA